MTILMREGVHQGATASLGSKHGVKQALHIPKCWIWKLKVRVQNVSRDLRDEGVVVPERLGLSLAVGWFEQLSQRVLRTAKRERSAVAHELSEFTCLAKDRESQSPRNI